MAKHHYVPQMYLRGFLDPSRKQAELWQYAAGFRPRPKAPAAVAFQRLFYDAPSELAPAENNVEAVLSRLESNSAAILQAMREGRIPVRDSERQQAALFIAAMTTRMSSFAKVLTP